MTTIRDAWLFGRTQLHESPTPALDARLLLEHVLGHDHAYLVAHDDELIPAEPLVVYRDLVGRATAHEPIPYLMGHAPFLDLDFAVSHDVLIPRPETEKLVETAIYWGKGRGAMRVIDVGTGSGCIAVSLARHLPQADVVAVDISAKALAVAATNAARHAPGSVSLVQADLLSSVAPGFDLIVANLPYIAGHEWPTLPIGVKSYEPSLALYGGHDGLDLFRRLLPQSAERLNTGGLVLLEIGWQQGESVAGMARALFPAATIAVEPDFAGLDRIVSIRR